MTGPAHYAKAEEHLAAASEIETDGHDDSMSAWHQRQAQAHATLALAAATALPGQYSGDWEDVILPFGREPTVGEEREHAAQSAWAARVIP